MNQDSEGGTQVYRELDQPQKQLGINIEPQATQGLFWRGGSDAQRRGIRWRVQYCKCQSQRRAEAALLEPDPPELAFSPETEPWRSLTETQEAAGRMWYAERSSISLWAVLVINIFLPVMNCHCSSPPSSWWYTTVLFSFFSQHWLWNCEQIPSPPDLLDISTEPDTFKCYLFLIVFSKPKKTLNACSFSENTETHQAVISLHYVDIL